MILNRTVVATAWAVTLAEAKAHLSYDSADQDTLITALIKAASEQIGEMAGRVLTQETWTAASEDFYDMVRLPKSPIIAVSAISYFDAAGNSQAATVGDFNVFLSEDYSLIRPKIGFNWPTAQDRPDAVTITFTAGYSAVPFGLKYAVLLLIGHLFQNREGVVVGTIAAVLPMAVESLVNSHRLGWAAG